MPARQTVATPPTPALEAQAGVEPASRPGCARCCRAAPCGRLRAPRRRCSSRPGRAATRQRRRAASRSRPARWSGAGRRARGRCCPGACASRLHAPAASVHAPSDSLDVRLHAAVAFAAVDEEGAAGVGGRGAVDVEVVEAPLRDLAMALQPELELAALQRGQRRAGRAAVARQVRRDGRLDALAPARIDDLPGANSWLSASHGVVKLCE